jgi:hypothetical protein
MMQDWPVAQIEAEKRRLAVLRYLAGCAGYEAAAVLVLLHLRDRGIPTSSDQLNATLAWLAEAGLATLRDAEGQVARVTPRGREVGLGLARQPGVLPPDP